MKVMENRRMVYIRPEVELHAMEAFWLMAQSDRHEGDPSNPDNPEEAKEGFFDDTNDDFWSNGIEW